MHKANFVINAVLNVQIVHWQIKYRSLLVIIKLEKESKYLFKSKTQITSETVAFKMAGNFGKPAQDGNNGTMNSKVSNPC